MFPMRSKICVTINSRSARERRLIVKGFQLNCDSAALRSFVSILLRRVVAPLAQLQKAEPCQYTAEKRRLSLHGARKWSSENMQKSGLSPVASCEPVRACAILLATAWPPLAPIKVCGSQARRIGHRLNFLRVPQAFVIPITVLPSRFVNVMRQRALCHFPATYLIQEASSERCHRAEGR